MSTLTRYVDQINSENKAEIEKEKEIENLLRSKRRLNDALEMAINDVHKLYRSNPAEAMVAEAQFKADHMTSIAAIDRELQDYANKNNINLAGFGAKICDTAVATANMTGTMAGTLVRKPLQMLEGFGKSFLKAAKA